MNIQVNTNCTAEGMIRQEVIRSQGTVQDVILQQVVNLQDAGIRDALVQLGWRPPDHRAASTLSLSRIRQVRRRWSEYTMSDTAKYRAFSLDAHTDVGFLLECIDGLLPPGTLLAAGSED